MNKTIYINNENREQVIKASEKESINSLVNKALKYYFSGNSPQVEKKPVKKPRIEIKKPAEVSEQKKELPNKYKGLRLPSNW